MAYNYDPPNQQPGMAPNMQAMRDKARLINAAEAYFNFNWLLVAYIAFIILVAFIVVLSVGVNNSRDENTIDSTRLFVMIASLVVMTIASFPTMRKFAMAKGKPESSAIWYSLGFGACFLVCCLMGPVIFQLNCAGVLRPWGINLGFSTRKRDVLMEIERRFAGTFSGSPYPR